MRDSSKIPEYDFTSSLENLNQYIKYAPYIFPMIVNQILPSTAKQIDPDLEVLTIAAFVIIMYALRVVKDEKLMLFMKK